MRVFLSHLAAFELLDGEALHLLGEDVSSNQEGFSDLYRGACRDLAVLAVAPSDQIAYGALVGLGKAVCVHVLLEGVVVVLRGPVVLFVELPGDWKPKALSLL